MTILLGSLLGLFAVSVIGFCVKLKLDQKRIAALETQLVVERQRADLADEHCKTETARAFEEAKEALKRAQECIDVQRTNLESELDGVRQHYESESRRAHVAATELVIKLQKDIERLSKYENVRDAEAEAQRVLADAVAEAENLRSRARELMEQSRVSATEQHSEATQKAREIAVRADAMLDRATREAGRLVDEAHKRAEQIAGDAYTSLRDKERLEQALVAVRNVIDGYGDRYVIPTRSVLDDLAADFGHTEAGQELAAAREQTRRMVEESQAADCEYADSDRRETAIRFVIDAFNGRVDAILSRAKHDNVGTLRQEIRDAFALVNKNGTAFRDARILPAYLDARLCELKWAVVVQELRLKEREEQRRIKEQIREEEKARREYERATEEAQKEEALIQKALKTAHAEAERATAEQRTALEQQIESLNAKLAEAEAKSQRALSMAQQTRKGTVYIISNVGSFGDEVFKIGMTRRLEPLDRIKELGDASVPYEFDIHAMLSCDDAPALECLLHGEFEEFRINKVNYRKEFFRVPLEKVRSFIAARGIQASFTLLAEAHEYRETQALDKMSPEERERYHLRANEDSDCE
jgi:hypothetical protein